MARLVGRLEAGSIEMTSQGEGGSERGDIYMLKCAGRANPCSMLPWPGETPSLSVKKVEFMAQIRGGQGEGQ